MCETAQHLRYSEWCLMNISVLTLVCSCYRNKNTINWVAWTTEMYLSQLQKLWSPKSGAGLSAIPLKAPSGICCKGPPSLCPLMAERERKAMLSFLPLLKEHSCYHGSPPSPLHLMVASQRAAHIQVPSWWRVVSSLGRQTSVRFIVPLCLCILE